MMCCSSLKVRHSLPQPKGIFAWGSNYEAIWDLCEYSNTEFKVEFEKNGLPFVESGFVAIL